jgi:signal transduction histidine kinase
VLPPEFAERLHKAKLEAMAELAYGASHEINNPLANIATRAQALIPGETDPRRRAQLETIYQQAMRAHDMIAALMLFARPPMPQRAPTDVAKLVRRVVVEVEPWAADQRTTIRAEVATTPLVASIDATQIKAALRAIIDNALEALAEGGTIAVALQQLEDAERRYLEIEITDDGPGLSAEALEHMFDPFYSGREAGRGLGMGLAKAWRIIDLHGGRLRAAAVQPHGARLTVKLPVE